MYIVPIGFFIIFLMSTTTGLLLMFKLRKKNKYNVVTGAIFLGTGILFFIACIFFCNYFFRILKNATEKIASLNYDFSLTGALLHEEVKLFYN